MIGPTFQTGLDEFHCEFFQGLDMLDASDFQPFHRRFHEPTNQDGQGLGRDLTFQTKAGDLSRIPGRLAAEAVPRPGRSTPPCNVDALVNGSDDLLAILATRLMW